MPRKKLTDAQLERRIRDLRLQMDDMRGAEYQRAFWKLRSLIASRERRRFSRLRRGYDRQRLQEIRAMRKLTEMLEGKGCRTPKK